MNTHMHTHRLKGVAVLKLWVFISHSAWTGLTSGWRNKQGEKCCRSHWGQQTSTPGRETPRHTGDPQNTQSAKLPILQAERGEEMSQKSSQICNEDGNWLICSLICYQVIVPALINQTNGDYQLLWITPLISWRVSHGCFGPGRGGGQTQTIDFVRVTFQHMCTNIICWLKYFHCNIRLQVLKIQTNLADSYHQNQETVRTQ